MCRAKKIVEWYLVAPAPAELEFCLKSNPVEHRESGPCVMDHFNPVLQN